MINELLICYFLKFFEGGRGEVFQIGGDPYLKKKLENFFHPNKEIYLTIESPCRVDRKHAVFNNF